MDSIMDRKISVRCYLCDEEMKVTLSEVMERKNICKKCLSDIDPEEWFTIQEEYDKINLYNKGGLNG